MNEAYKEQIIKDQKPLPEWGVVHFILSHSYIVFLVAVICGVILDILTGITLYQTKFFEYVGLVMLLVGPMLIYWAQHTSHTTKNKMETHKT